MYDERRLKKSPICVCTRKITSGMVGATDAIAHSSGEEWNVGIIITYILFLEPKQKHNVAGPV